MSVIRRNQAPRGVRPWTAGPGWGPLAAALEALGVAGPPLALALLPTLVGSTGAVAMSMSFAIFGRKRRAGEPSAADEVLRAEAGQTGHAPGGELVSATGAASSAAPLDEEAAMPRWRRPSLIQARKADPLHSVASAPRLSFEGGRVGPVEGRQRRLVRYRVVRLMDGPDEFRAAELGQLDQGDEVQLLEKAGAYWLVLCPDGRRGWLHQMTLGEVVGEPASPTTGEGQDGDVDQDVLQAFLSSRSRP